MLDTPTYSSASWSHHRHPGIRSKDIPPLRQPSLQGHLARLVRYRCPRESMREPRIARRGRKHVVQLQLGERAVLVPIVRLENVREEIVTQWAELD